MLKCPICQRRLDPFSAHPHAPICSDACRREAMRRAGIMEEPAADQPAGEPQFEELHATHLYCAGCGRSTPTRQQLLLSLPDGDLYGYTCATCGQDVGTKTARR